MNSMLLVGLGGAIGSIARFKIGGWVTDQFVQQNFPLGTFVVNVAGCLIIGLLAGLAAKEDIFSSDARIFIFTGIMGGFTTFSTFGLETFNLLRRDLIAVAGMYVSSSVVCGLVALWAGFSVVYHLSK